MFFRISLINTFFFFSKILNPKMRQFSGAILLSILKLENPSRLILARCIMGNFFTTLFILWNSWIKFLKRVWSTPRVSVFSSNQFCNWCGNILVFSPTIYFDIMNHFISLSSIGKNEVSAMRSINNMNVSRYRKKYFFQLFSSQIVG